MQIDAADIRPGDTVCALTGLTPIPHMTVAAVHTEEVDLPTGPTTMVYVSGTAGMYPLFSEEVVWRIRPRGE